MSVLADLMLRQILSNQFTLMKLELHRLVPSQPDIPPLALPHRIACTDKILRQAYGQSQVVEPKEPSL